MKTIRFIFIVLFAALICAGCFIAVPIGVGGIPIVMQNMFAVLAGCLLGGADGFFASLIFIAAGLLGLPVFSGGRGGIAHVFGPTGGFIAGYAFASLFAGLIAQKPYTGKSSVMSVIRLFLAAASGFVVLYVPGVLWFMHVTKRTFSASMGACVVPFILGDMIKLALTVVLSLKLRPVVAQYLEK